MHRYRIVAQISLILSILNLVLAAPIVAQEIREARGNEMVVAADVAAKPKKRHGSESEAAPDGSTPPPSNPDAVASPQHSSLSDGSTSSGYPSPYLSSASSVSGYSWLLERPPRLDLPASLIESAPPHPSSSGPSELPRPDTLEIPPSPHLPASLHESASPHPSSSGSSVIELPEWAQELAPEIPPSPHLPASLPESASPHPLSSGSSEIQLPEWLQGLIPGSPSHPYVQLPETPPHIPWLPPEMWRWPSPSSSGSPLSELPSVQFSGPDSDAEIPPSAHLSLSDAPTTETYSPLDRFTPSHHPSSLSSTDGYSDESIPTQYLTTSGGSLSSHYFSALDGSVPLMPEGLAQSHHLTSDGSPRLPSSLPTETPPDNTEFLDKNVIKKFGIVAGVVIVGGIIAGIVGSQIKHHEHRDLSDS